MKNHKNYNIEKIYVHRQQSAVKFKSDFFQLVVQMTFSLAHAIFTILLSIFCQMGTFD